MKIIPSRRIVPSLLECIFSLLSCALAGVPAAFGEEAPKVLYDKDIRPIFAKNCYECHGPQKQEGGLRLDVREKAFEGGDSGQVLIKGHSAKSLLIELVSGADPEQSMPPGDKRLTKDEVARLRAWVDQGLDWPDEHAGELKKSTHWAFQPVQRVAPPAVQQREWVRNPIDAFVLARLSDVCKVGDEMPVKVIAIDEQDRVKLSRKVALRERAAAGNDTGKG